jgi:hypothetical protein
VATVRSEGGGVEVDGGNATVTKSETQTPCGR